MSVQILVLLSDKLYRQYVHKYLLQCVGFFCPYELNFTLTQVYHTSHIQQRVYLSYMYIVENGHRLGTVIFL